MKRMGLRMGGCEEPLEKMFIEYLNDSKDSFSYLEIGAAGCVTFKSIYEIVKENFKNDNFSLIALDLVDGWSLDWRDIQNFKNNFPLNIFKNKQPQEGNSEEAKASLVLESDPRKFISEMDDESLDICFIDGCHGRPCVMKDFETVEPKIKSGGIVFFHDVGEPEQGTDWQGHCNEYINARQAIIDLGLLEETREKWKVHKDIRGSRYWGGDGNSIIAFIKK